ncbi:NitT/TauT family transport system permease protein [Acidaminobacter hydrogenoformans DSM 2784]|uniref:NitT/TauT family transport system permease protein n=1 Tax=Acidaminobacter hydrogenoformans DSM 2784 TaxID=1120920 RepID=A0A1G5RQF2_9FIRM|nr:NitT/TauT family transport system permease protein [Acidaminobacter hydrogenoformans DSM 2784]
MEAGGGVKHLRRLKRIAGSLGVAAFWLGLWQLAAWLVGSPFVLPSPLAVFSRLSTLIFERDFAISTAWSVYRVLLSLLIAVSSGVVLGGLSFVSPLARRLIAPAMLAIRSAPVVSFIILAIMWMDSNYLPVFISLLMCLPVIWGNVLQGLGAVDGRLVEMSELYGVSRTKVWKQLYLRAVWPYLNAALFTCLGLGFKVTVAAEVLSSPKYAIGYQMYVSKLTLETEAAYAWTVVILLLSLLFEVWLKHLLKRDSERREAA